MARIVDTTLRDGEQQAGIALSMDEKVQIARILDKAGIYQIEAGVPAMGGDEKKSILKMMELGLTSKISTWNRVDLNDIKHSIECKPDIIHISVPTSDIQIKYKLAKNKSWIVETLKRCIEFALKSGCEVTVGLEDASRTDIKFLLGIISAACAEGIRRVRYADTLGISGRQKIFSDISIIKLFVDVEVEIHTHNDLGMAVANSVSAVKAGAEFVDCTIGGIGERAGNCNYAEYIKSAKACLNLYKEMKLKDAADTQNSIMKIIYNI